MTIDWNEVRKTYRQGELTFVPMDLCDDPTVGPAIERLAAHPYYRLKVVPDPNVSHRVWVVADLRLVQDAVGLMIREEQRGTL